MTGAKEVLCEETRHAAEVNGMRFLATAPDVIAIRMGKTWHISTTTLLDCGYSERDAEAAGLVHCPVMGMMAWPKNVDPVWPIPRTLANSRILYIEHAVANGKTQSQIGAVLGISKQRVSVLMQERGIVPNGKSVGKSVNPYGGAGHPDRSRRVSVLRRVARNGGRFIDAANELGVSRSVVAGVAHRAGIKFGRD